MAAASRRSGRVRKTCSDSAVASVSMRAQHQHRHERVTGDASVSWRCSAGSASRTCSTPRRFSAASGVAALALRASPRGRTTSVPCARSGPSAARAAVRRSASGWRVPSSSGWRDQRMRPSGRSARSAPPRHATAACPSASTPRRRRVGWPALGAREPKVEATNSASASASVGGVPHRPLRLPPEVAHPQQRRRTVRAGRCSTGASCPRCRDPGPCVCEGRVLRPGASMSPVGVLFANCRIG